MKRLSIVVALLSIASGIVLSGQVRKEVFGVGQGVATTPSADPFFDDSVLQEFSLTINSRDWQSLKDHYLENTYYPVDFKWRDIVVRNAGIRSRGGGSRSGVKPGLRIDFNRYVTDQTFLGLKSFVLRNNTQDPSNMHERLSMLLFRRVGLPASREAHTKVNVNNGYEGLFTIVESVDKLFLKRTFNEDSGYLYKYEYVDNDPYYFEDRGSNPESYVPTHFKPETHDTDSRPEVVVNLVQTINQTSDANFRTAIADYIDLTRFVRHVAVERFVTDQDGFLSDYGGMNNYYFYRFDNRNLFTFIAWDKSEAFKGGVSYNIMHNITDVPSTKSNRLLARALSFPDIFSAYLNALVDCVNAANEKLTGSTDTRGWLEREIEREYNQIHAAALADTTKPYSNADFEQAVVDLTNFARQRSDIVTSQVNALR